MSKYRITEVKKAGFYRYYTVQERIFLFFWHEPTNTKFDSVEDAKTWIKNNQVKRLEHVVEYL